MSGAVVSRSFVRAPRNGQLKRFKIIFYNKGKQALAQAFHTLANNLGRIAINTGDIMWSCHTLKYVCAGMYGTHGHTYIYIYIWIGMANIWVEEKNFCCPVLQASQGRSISSRRKCTKIGECGECGECGIWSAVLFVLYIPLFAAVLRVLFSLSSQLVHAGVAKDAFGCTECRRLMIISLYPCCIHVCILWNHDVRHIAADHRPTAGCNLINKSQISHTHAHIYVFT